jgi:hypothetical protein
MAKVRFPVIENPTWPQSEHNPKPAYCAVWNGPKTGKRKTSMLRTSIEAAVADVPAGVTDAVIEVRYIAGFAF